MVPRDMPHEPFYQPDGDRFVPTDAAAGPWAAKTLHGRVVIGLLGQELERRHGDADFMPARLTVELYRGAPAEPVEVVSRVVRDGRRVRLAEADFRVGGVSCARASLQFLRLGETPPRLPWTRPPWGAAPPAQTPDADAIWTRRNLWELRFDADFLNGGPRRAWMRELHEMVGGRRHTPFSRVAASVDFASPMAHATKEGGDYINTDLTLYLHRPPVGEWVGFETANHGATAGVAVGHCFLDDEAGPIGFAGCAALAHFHLSAATALDGWSE
jgi:hypothetical protein